MALSRDEVERLRRLQQQLSIRSQFETERALFRLTRSIGDLTRRLSPVRARLIDAVMQDRMGDADAIEEAMSGLVTTWLRETFAPLERDTIRKVIRDAAVRGAQSVDLAPTLATSDARTLDALLRLLSSSGGSGTTASIGVGYGRISSAVQRQIEQKVYRDGLNLSRRLHVRLRQREAEFKQILSQGLKEGRGAIRLAKRMQTLDVTDARIPKYLRELERTLRGTKDVPFVDELRRAMAEAAKRKSGPLGIRGPSNRVIQAARTGSIEKLNEAMDYFLERKIRYHSLVIARTSANEAFLAGFVEQAKESPHVVGVKWHLSASHSRPCECDVLAEQNLYGLGPGVYPVDAVPERPHPQCFCYHTTVVDLERMLNVV